MSELDEAPPCAGSPTASDHRWVQATVGKRCADCGPGSAYAERIGYRIGYTR